MCSGRWPADQLEAAVDALAAEDLDRSTSVSLAEDLVNLRRLADRIEYEFTRRLSRFDASQGYAACGAAGSKHWLRVNCRLSGWAAAQRVEVARDLHELPETAAAFAAGEISYQHTACISRVAGQVGVEVAREAEPILVAAARRLDPTQMRYVTNHLRHCLDPDGALDDANQAFGRRRVHLSQIEDVFYLDGILDAEAGACLTAALNALMGPRRLGDLRHAGQRRADALMELARRQLDHGELPEVGGQRPHLSLTASAASLRLQPGAPPAELEWASMVPRETARRLACDAAVTPILLDPDDRAVSAGRTARVISGPLRRALVTRDRGCRFPDCDRPPAWTDAHHIVHWADGGQTSLKNTVLLCRPHHRQVHEESWRLAWEPDGDLVALPP